MTAAIYHRKMARTLERMGGLYTLNDVLGAIAEGKMQSFVEGNSWAVTQVLKYPRATVLDIFSTVGDLEDCRILHGTVLEYARELGIGLVTAKGRRGWAPDAAREGWRVKTTSYLYHREL